MCDNFSSVDVCDCINSDCDLANSDTLASKALADTSWDLVFSTILFSNDLAVASCDLTASSWILTNWDSISCMLELGRDWLLCLVPRATSSSSSWSIKLKDCEAIWKNYYYTKTNEINALYHYANLNSQSHCPIIIVQFKYILPRKDYTARPILYQIKLYSPSSFSLALSLSFLYPSDSIKKTSINSV